MTAISESQIKDIISSHNICTKNPRAYKKGFKHRTIIVKTIKELRDENRLRGGLVQVAQLEAETGLSPAVVKKALHYFVGKGILHQCFPNGRIFKITENFDKKWGEARF